MVPTASLAAANSSIGHRTSREVLTIERPGRDRSSTDDLLPAASRLSDLSILLPKVQDLFKKSASVFKPHTVYYEKTLRELHDETVALRVELLTWASTQSATVQPWPFQRFTMPYTLTFLGAAELTCPVLWADMYSDCSPSKPRPVCN
jgi:hypothetical protein